MASKSRHGIFTVDDAALTSEATGEQMAGELCVSVSTKFSIYRAARPIQVNTETLHFCLSLKGTKAGIFARLLLSNASSQTLFDAQQLTLLSYSKRTKKTEIPCVAALTCSALNHFAIQI